MGAKTAGRVRYATYSKWDECEGRSWDAVRKALDFARKNIEEQDYPDLKSQLRPFLTSNADITQCYEMPGQAVLCEIKNSPWGKLGAPLHARNVPAVLPTSGFCTYTIIPLFKVSDDGTLRSKGGGAYPKIPWPGESEQAKVAPYIRQLEDLVHSKLVVPPRTPGTARLKVLANFDGDTGRIHNVSALRASPNSGCDCPEYRDAVTEAVNQVAAFPLLPIEERGHVGGGQGGAPVT